MSSEEKITEFFKILRTKGTRALAYCKEEESRVLLLELLEEAADSEIEIISTLKTELEENHEDIIVSHGEGIDESILSETGPISREITVDTSDKIER